MHFCVKLRRGGEINVGRKATENGAHEVPHSMVSGSHPCKHGTQKIYLSHRAGRGYVRA